MSKKLQEAPLEISMVSLDFGLKTVRFRPLAPASSPRVDASHAWAVAGFSPALLGPWRCLGTVVASRISLEIPWKFHGVPWILWCFSIFLGAYDAYELFKQWTSCDQGILEEFFLVARWWGLMAVTLVSLLLAPYDTVKTWFHTGLPQNLKP